MALTPMVILVGFATRLTQQEREIFVYRYGLLSGSPASIEDTAKKFGVPTKTIVRTEHDILKRLGGK